MQEVLAHWLVRGVEECSYLSKLWEVWPLVHVSRPTLLDDVVEVRVTVSRPLQPVAVPHLPHHLPRTHPRVRGGAQRHDLPHQDTEPPHVRLGSEDGEVERLRGHPPDGQGSLRLLLVHLTAQVPEVPGQAEVWYLGVLCVIHQNVPGGQIAVDDLQISMRERRHLALRLTPLDTRYSIPLATPYANLVRSLEVRASPTSPPSLEKLKNEDCFIRCSRKWVSNFPYITYSITQRYGSGMRPRQVLPVSWLQFYLVQCRLPVWLLH